MMRKHGSTTNLVRTGGDSASAIATHALSDISVLRLHCGGVRRPRTAPAMSKIGRNEACPCGSGKKYKKFHGDIASPSPAVFDPSEINRMLDQQRARERIREAQQAVVGRLPVLSKASGRSSPSATQCISPIDGRRFPISWRNTKNRSSIRPGAMRSSGNFRLREDARGIRNVRIVTTGYSRLLLPRWSSKNGCDMQNSDISIIRHILWSNSKPTQSQVGCV
jgi:SEC-C motif